MENQIRINPIKMLNSLGGFKRDQHKVTRKGISEDITMENAAESIRQTREKHKKYFSKGIIWL